MTSVNTKDLLSKKKSELTPEELKALTKVIGGPGRPYPTKSLQSQRTVKEEGGEKKEVYTKVLSVYEDAANPLSVLSERDFAEVYGIALRDMPSPSMLDIFADVMNSRRISSQRPVTFIIGDPGVGKSFLGKMLGRMKSKKGPLVVDCGGKNLAELMYETVLDLDKDSSFYNSFDAKLKEGLLNRVSLETLQNAVKAENKEKADATFIKEGDEIVGVNWDEFPVSDQTMAALDKIGKFENLLGSGNALGMITQEGPLLEAWKEGREVVLDEYNKSKEGTDDSLQIIWQFLVGEIDYAEYENPLKEKGAKSTQKFIFKREDQKAGFGITLTGNAVEDGISTRPLSKSVYSRITPIKLGKTTAEDGQHRWCQKLTGLPVSTLYNIASEQWDNDPESFTNFLLQARVLGLSEEQVKNVPKHEMDMIRNWPRVLEATEKLARFFHEWEAMINPDDPAHGDVTFANGIDDNYYAETSIDDRKTTLFVQRALAMDPEAVSIAHTKGFDLSVTLDQEISQKDVVEAEDPLVRFGSRIVKEIMKLAVSTSQGQGKDGLYEALMNQAETCGLKKATLQEGAASNHKTIEELLNINPYTSQDHSTQIQVLQGLIAERIRQIDPEVKAGNEQIIPASHIRRALDELSEKQLASHHFIVANNDAETVEQSPFIFADHLDAIGETTEDYLEGVSAAELISKDDFITSLVAPKLRDHNTTALWTTALSTHADLPNVDNPAVQMAENRHESGVAVTSVQVASNDAEQVETYHLVRNEKSENLLIVGPAMSDYLVSELAKCNIKFIDIAEENARGHIDSTLDEYTAHLSEDEKEYLKLAFLNRNMIADQELPEDKETLGMLMTSTDLEAIHPTFLAKREDQAEENVQAARRRIRPQRLGL